MTILKIMPKIFSFAFVLALFAGVNIAGVAAQDDKWHEARKKQEERWRETSKKEAEFHRESRKRRQEDRRESRKKSDEYYREERKREAEYYREAAKREAEDRREWRKRRQEDRREYRKDEREYRKERQKDRREDRRDRDYRDHDDDDYYYDDDYSEYRPERYVTAPRFGGYDHYEPLAQYIPTGLLAAASPYIGDQYEPYSAYDIEMLQPCYEQDSNLLTSTIGGILNILNL